MSEWTDSETRELVGLWPSHSAAQIAAYLHKPRSAISSKVHRLREEGVPLAAVKHFAVRPVRVPGRARMIGNVPTCRNSRSVAGNPAPADEKHNKNDTAGDHTAGNPAPPAKQPCTLLELEAGRCHWPLDLGHQVATLFCGGDAEPGRRYCPHHRRMAARS